MTAAAQSSPDDIDSWTRAYAEEQARLSGVSVREWIEQFVAQTAAEPEATSLELDAAPVHEPWDADSVAETPSEIAETPEEPEPEEPDWISRASAAFAVVEAQPIDAAPASPAEAMASAPAPDQPHDDEVEHVLDELQAQVDVVRSRMTARLRDDSARRLDGIERALRGMREQIQAAEQAVAPSGEAVTDNPDAPSPYFAGAAEARALEAARMVELMDSGFERLEASSAMQMAGLRADIEQLFGALTARLDHLEQRPAPLVAEVVSRSPPAMAVVDVEPAPEVIEAEPQPAPLAAEATEPHAQPSEFDSDLFDDFTEPPAPTLRDLLNAAPVAAVDTSEPEPAPFAHEPAPFAAEANEDDDLVDSDDDWAAAGSAPIAWPEASRATTAREFGADTWDAAADPLPLTIRAPDHGAGQTADAAPGAAKTSLFSLFGRGQNRLRKSA